MISLASELAASHTTMPIAGALLDGAVPATTQGSAMTVEQALGERLGLLARGEALGEVEELVAAEAAQRVRGARHLLEAPGDRPQQLVAREVAEGVVHALEVVEVDQQDGADAAVARDARVGLVEPVLEERPVGQAGQGVVQGAVRELGREGALLGDVALGEDEVEDLARGVARRRPRDLDVDHPAVLAQVALDVALLVDLVRGATRWWVSSVMPTSSG